MNKKVSKDLFINNINYLMKYDYGLEFTIVTNCDSFNEYFIVLYEDYIEINNNDKSYVVKDVYELLDHIDYNDIAKIDSSLDFNFPFENQSIVKDGKLWFNPTTPTKELKKFNKTYNVIKLVCVIGNILIFLYTVLLSIQELLAEDNNKYNLLIGLTVIVLIIILYRLISFFDKRKDKIIETYYGVVTDEDKLKAKKLHDNINIIKENKYDISRILKFSNSEEIIEFVLERLSKGNKVHIYYYNNIRKIKELIQNEKYNDEIYNNYIYELCELLENNTYENLPK